MHWLRHIAAWALILVGVGVATARAQPAAEPLDVPARYGYFRVAHVLHDDMSSSETRSWSVTVLHARALEWARQFELSHSASAQSLEVLEAYTRKADGRRVEVPAHNYQLSVDSGHASGRPLFSDLATLTVVFPDVAVGDTVVFGYRITQREPTFPGHFDAGGTFARHVAFDAVEASVEHPADLKVKSWGREMAQAESTPAPGRRRIEWRWSNPRPRQPARRDESVFDPDQEVGYDFSTFADHSAIAQAYAARAHAKAVPSARVRALAAAIVGDRAGARPQAQALYEWVAGRISYAGHCVGVGTVVPRDLDVVLDNRMGDCKDHATLLQALLAARGVPSRQVLVNADNIYTLPRIARAGRFNHVILHLPSLGMYADPTAGGVPFGHLPAALRGKPVVDADPAGTGVRLPVPAIATAQRTVSAFEIADDGSMSGSVEVSYQGDVAMGMRAWGRRLPPEARAELVGEMLQSLGLGGSGRLELDDPAALDDKYHLRIGFDRVAKFIRLPGSGAFVLAPLVGGATIGRLLEPASTAPAQRAQVCASGASTEVYSFALPPSVEVLALPPSVRFDDGTRHYTAHYEREGRVIRATRVLEDRTPLVVCDPAELDARRRFADRVRDDLNAQVLYR